MTKHEQHRMAGERIVSGRGFYFRKLVTPVTISETEQQKGVLYGVTAYSLWGLFPLYFKLVAHIDSREVMAHRVFWSFIFLAGIVTLHRRWREVGQILGSRRVMGPLVASTLMIGTNWLVFIYAIASDQVLQSSLGSFIIPLLNVALGVVFLHERLRPFQSLAVGLAALGVLLLTLLGGAVPWVALVLGVSFAVYGLLRKKIPADGLMCLTIETLVLFPLAGGYLAFLGMRGEANAVTLGTWGLLSLSGVLTTIPLLFFGAAARRLRLSTMGILQFLSPSLKFLLAVLLYREPFLLPQLVSFSCIWTAVLVYSVDSVQSYRISRRESLKALGAATEP